MKKKIIFVQFTKFLDFHYNLYEVEYLKKYFDIELHDLSYIFNKNIHKNYKYLKNTKNIINFYDFNSWMKKIFKEHKTYREKLFLFYNGNPLNLSFIYYHSQIILKKINIIEPHFNVIPKVDIYEGYTYKENIKYKFYRIVKRFNHVIYDFISKIIRKFIVLTYNFFPPKYLLCCGSTNYDNLKKNFPNSKIISLNSWECSKIYINKKKYNKFNKKNINGIYLSSFSKKSATDSSFYKYKKLEASEKVLNEMNLFLDKVEKFSKKKINICLHPRSEKFKKFQSLGNRRSFYNLTDFLVKNASFVITHMSVACSYAVLFYKPLIFVATKEHHKNKYLIRYSKMMAQFLGAKYIDLKRKTENSLNNNIFKIDKKKYRYFIKNYLVSKSFNETPNYKILEKIIN